jgi:adenine-specific DNA-methyltransferase
MFPVNLADKLGLKFALTQPLGKRKEYGIYLTPPALARFMTERLDLNSRTMRILDPAAGAGILLCAVVERIVNERLPVESVVLEAYEIIPEMFDVLCNSLGYLVVWASDHGLTVSLDVHRSDFLSHETLDKAVDVAIANPPYAKIRKADDVINGLLGKGHIHPNLYTAFMTHSSHRLKSSGELVFVTPRSYSSGVQFRRFREEFFGDVDVKSVHTFDSRSQPFLRDGVLQETVILWGSKTNPAPFPRDQSLTISHSKGTDDILTSNIWNTTQDKLFDVRGTRKNLRLPSSFEDEQLMIILDSLPETVESLGFTVSTGPVVPFRINGALRDDDSDERAVPLIWMRNLVKEHVVWPIPKDRKQFLLRDCDTQSLLLPNQDYVFIPRWSSKDQDRRLFASFYASGEFGFKFIGIENHVNYVCFPGVGALRQSIKGLQWIMNSVVMDRYMRSINGTTQVGALDVRMMPMPSMDIVDRWGVVAGCGSHTNDDLSELILEYLMSLNENPRRKCLDNCSRPE